MQIEKSVTQTNWFFGFSAELNIYKGKSKLNCSCYDYGRCQNCNDFTG